MIPPSPASPELGPARIPRKPPVSKVARALLVEADQEEVSEEKVEQAFARAAASREMPCSDADDVSFAASAAPTVVEPEVSQTEASTTEAQQASPGEQPVWPSLREATTGWDFCSEAAASEGSSWLDVQDSNAHVPSKPEVPLPAVATGISAWGLRAEEGADTAPARPSFAELLRSQAGANVQQAALPPAAGTRLQVSSRRRVPAAGREAAIGEECELCDDGFPAAHGWSKEHKANWNSRIQRK
ncbi:unnamed protein product, partial [Polarella glacialis]